ncbi:MAG: hypothetical protein AAF493_08315 [Pseudomonadota bacterium]
MTYSFDWPQSMLFANGPTREQAAQKARQPLHQWLQEERIDTQVLELLPALYVPLAAWVDHQVTACNGQLVVGLCGGQGSGKSTLAHILSVVLEAGFSRRTAAVSIDDIYKTHEERQAMAQQVHPLFATRGVPGTHDVALGRELLDTLRTLKHGERSAIPRFDKAADTRAPRSMWAEVRGPIDVIILEGWCVGAAPQSDDALAQPINTLEANEDQDGGWRNEVNRALRDDYPQVFGELDLLLLLQVSGMESVFQWRRLQEEKLRAAIDESGGDRKRVMSNAEVDRFVMHYERITRHILSEMPGRADAVFPIGADHNPAHVHFNRPD